MNGLWKSITGGVWPATSTVVTGGTTATSSATVTNQTLTGSTARSLYPAVACFPRATADPRFFKKPLEKALFKLWRNNSRPLVTVGHFYKHMDSDLVVELLGPIRPIYNGKPKVWVMNLLMSATPNSFQGMGMFKNAGLVFYGASVIGRKKRKCQLSAAGLALLEHWAEKHKNFKPFFDAFVTKKAKRQILSMCFDFEMNHIPDQIKQDLDKHRAGLQKQAIEEVGRLRQAASDNATHIVSNWMTQNIINARSAMGYYSSARSAIGVGSSVQTHSPWQATNQTSAFPPSYSDAYIVAEWLRQHTKMTIHINGPQVRAIDQLGETHDIWRG